MLKWQAAKNKKCSTKLLIKRMQIVRMNEALGCKMGPLSKEWNNTAWGQSLKLFWKF